MLSDSGPSLGDDGAGYNRPIQKRNARQRDDKVHDSIIEERLQRERPCRTLFIRNIKASFPWASRVVALMTL